MPEDRDQQERFSLQDAFDSVPEMSPEDDFRSQLMDRIDSEGVTGRKRKLSVTGRTLTLALIVFVFGVLPYLGGKYYRHISGHDEFISQVQTEMSQKQARSERLARNIHARFNYSVQQVPSWAPHYRVELEGREPDEFFSRLFTQYTRGEIDREALRPFYEQSNVFHDAYVKYDLSGSDLTGPRESPVLVFGRNLPNRFTIRVLTADLKQLHTVLDTMGAKSADGADYRAKEFTRKSLNEESSIVSFLTVTFE